MNAPRPLPTKNVTNPDDANSRSRRASLPCPHCNAPTLVRHSHLNGPLNRDMYHLCLNVDCGFTFKTTLAFVWGLSPSANPMPGLDLKMAPDHIVRRTYFPPPPDYDERQMGMFDDSEPPPEPPGPTTG